MIPNGTGTPGGEIDRASIELQLVAMFPPDSASGKLFVALGGEPKWDDRKAKYSVDNGWRERQFDWPQQREQALDTIAEAAPARDVFVCAGLMHKVRSPASLKETWTLHVDWDGDPADAEACREKLSQLGGYAVMSGTPGHLAGFVPLAEPIVTSAEHDRMCKALQEFLPAGVDAPKHKANDVVRLAGTLNFKSTVRPGDTGTPRATAWAIKPPGFAMDNATLCRLLGTAEASDAPALPAAPRCATNNAELVPVDLDALPEAVAAVLAAPILKPGGTVDRSETTAHVVGAGVDTGLTLAEIRAAVNVRADLAQRVAEMLARTAPRDDVLRCYELAIATRDERRQEDLRDQAEHDSFFGQYRTNGQRQPDTEDAEPVEEPAQGTGGGQLDVQALEEDFWTSRDSLKHIYDTALARMASPWAVLGCTAARALATVRPNATLPPLIGGKGSLNWFAAIAAKSGGGKGSANAVARELVPGPVFMRNIGSGEGMVNAYADKESPTMTGKREAVMFNVDEVDMLTALGNRSGATIMSVLRSAFSGEALGFSYVARGGETLAEHSYRLTLVLGVQPARAGDLLADASGGTPQRFMWFPGSDSRINADAAWDIKPTPLTLPDFRTWQYPVEFQMPAEAVRFIRAEHAKRARGEGDAINGHAVFCREKLAVALALLDGRWQVTAEDWRLSGIAARVSDATRAWVAAELDAAAAAEAEKLGRQRGRVSAAADAEKAHQVVRRDNRITRWAEGKLKAAGPDGMLWRDLAHAAQSRDRPYLRDVLASMLKQGRVTASNAQRGGELWKIL